MFTVIMEVLDRYKEKVKALLTIVGKINKINKISKKDKSTRENATAKGERSLWMALRFEKNKEQSW